MDLKPRTRMEPTELIASMRAEIRRVLRPLFPHDRPAALMEFPVHSNPGDSAMWIGETRYLSEAAVPTVYLSDRFKHSSKRLARRLGQGTILLHGGGNIGDLYPAPQRFREEVIAAFPHNKIVQLPQSIHFDSRAALERARRAFGTHRDFTLLVRDQRSLDLARREFSCRTLLCPDIAFYIGELAVPRPPDTEIALLIRTDVEATVSSSEAGDLGYPARDWEPLPRTIGSRAEFRLRRGWSRLLGTLVAGPAHRSERLRARSAQPFDRVARQRVTAGCRLLASSRVVVTDRLHGHILAVLLGLPHVVLDNSYGKVKGFYETWTASWERAVWADSVEEALSLARDLGLDQPP
jgi:exopolysaccharide biosynthesis predicted pyruvyltransferase EpsI